MDDGSWYWVGRSSLFSWRKLAASQEEQRCAALNGHYEPADKDKDAEQESAVGSADGESETGTEERRSLQFNEDLLCEHSNALHLFVCLFVCLFLH